MGSRAVFFRGRSRFDRQTSFRTGMCAAAGVNGMAPIRESRLNITNDRTIVSQSACATAVNAVDGDIALNQHVSTDRDIADNKEPLSAICIVFD